MKRIRTAVVAGLIAVSAAAGATPAAAASSLEWSTYDWDKSASVCTDDWTPLTPGQTVVLQVMRSGVWTTARTVTVGTDDDCLPVDTAALTGKPGTYFLRALSRLVPGGPLLEGTTSVTLRAETPTPYFEDNREFYSLTSTKGRTVPLFVQGPNRQTVDVQRKVGGNWATVSRTTVPATTAAEALVRLPIPTRTGHATHRAVVRATAWTTQVISPTFTMHQTDTKKYASYLVTARKHMARFCPSTPIYVNPPAVQPGNPHNAIGMAMTDIDVQPDRRWRFEGWILLRAGMTGGQLKDVALHECAHIVQGRAAIEDKYWAEMDKAWGLWPAVGHEGQADCMAYHIMGTTKYLYYVRGCNSTQRANAQRMWQTWGYKYQGATYVFAPPASGASTAGSGADDALEPRFAQTG